MSSFMFKLIDAIGTASTTTSNQEFADIKTTDVNAQLESDIYSHYTSANGPLQADMNQINYWAGKCGPNADSSVQANLSKWQAQFQCDQTLFNAASNRGDSVVQSAQAQAGQDPSNLQQIIQLASASMTVLSTCTGLLSSSLPS